MDSSDQISKSSKPSAGKTEIETGQSPLKPQSQTSSAAGNDDNTKNTAVKVSSASKLETVNLPPNAEKSETPSRPTTDVTGQPSASKSGSKLKTAIQSHIKGKANDKKDVTNGGSPSNITDQKSTKEVNHVNDATATTSKKPESQRLAAQTPVIKVSSAGKSEPTTSGSPNAAATLPTPGPSGVVKADTLLSPAAAAAALNTSSSSTIAHKKKKKRRKKMRNHAGSNVSDSSSDSSVEGKGNIEEGDLALDVMMFTDPSEQGIQLCCHYVAVHPNSKQYRIWEIVVAVASIINCLLGMLLLSFGSTTTTFWVIIYICDSISILNILVSFFVAYVDDQGMPITKALLVARHYLRTLFFWDILSSLTFDLLYVEGFRMQTKNIGLLRLNRLLGLYRVFKFINRRQNELNSDTNFWYGAKCIVLGIFTLHIPTCLWYMLACSGFHADVVCHCGKYTWATKVDLDFGFEKNLNLSLNSDESASDCAVNAHSLTFKNYMLSLYWTVETVSSAGYGDILAVNYKEQLFAVLTMLLGMMVFYGVLLGGWSSILTNYCQQRAMFIHRVATIKRSLRDRKVPNEVEDHVLRYYSYLFLQKKLQPNDDFFDGLPMILKVDYYYSICTAAFLKATIFSDLTVEFKRMLSMYMREIMYLPGQIITSRGRIGSTMYYIHRGVVEVLSEDDDDSPVAIFKKGRVFGEMYLLHSAVLMASTRARTHCNLFALDRKDFDKLLGYFPEVIEKMQTELNERFKHADTDMKRTSTLAVPRFVSQANRKASYVAPLIANIRHIRGFFSDLLRAKNERQRQEKSVVISPSLELLPAEGSIEEYADVLQHTKFERLRYILKDIRTFIAVTTIHPHSYFYRVWDKIVTIIIVFLTLVHPYNACFSSDKSSGYFSSGLGNTMLVLTYVCDIFLLVDLFISLRTVIVTPNGDYAKFHDIVQHYVKSLKFVIDVLAIIPLEVFCLFFTDIDHREKAFAFLQFNRLFKFYRVTLAFDHMEESLDFSEFRKQGLKLLVYTVLACHLGACWLYASACFETHFCYDDSWIVVWCDSHSMLAGDLTAVQRYIISLYYAVVSMTNTGYGDIIGHDTLGYLCGIIVILVGMIVFAYTLSVLSATIANMDTPRTLFQERLFAMMSFMKEHKLNRKLRSRVVKYFCVLWDTHRGVWLPGQPSIVSDLPISLQYEVTTNDIFQRLSEIPLFHNIDDSFLYELSIRVVPYLFCPHEYIVNADDPVNEMYVIHRGLCERLSPDQKFVVDVLSPGKYVGALGMLFHINSPSTIRAKTYCEVLQIRNEDLEDILEKYPSVHRQFDHIRARKPEAVRMNEKTAQHIQELIAENKLESVKDADLAAASDNVNENEVPRLLNRLLRYFHIRDIGITKFNKTMADGSPNPDYLAPFDRLRKFPRLLSFLLMRWTFLPDGFIVKASSIGITFVGLIVAFLTPIHAAFLHRNPVLWTAVYIGDFLLLIYMYVIGLHTSFYRDCLITHPLSTAKRYFRSNFTYHILSIFPFELGVYAYFQNFSSDVMRLMAFARLNRLLQAYRLSMYFDYLESDVRKRTGYIRYIKFILYIVIVINWLSCALYTMACPPHLSLSDPDVVMTLTGQVCLSTSWLSNVDLISATMTDLYTTCVYFATVTFMTVGFGDFSPQTFTEMPIMTAVIFICQVIFAYLTASVTACITNADATLAHFREKLERAEAFMAREHLDVSLRRRVVRYYEYLWMRTHGIDPQSLFDGLPPSLWGTVSSGIYRNVISKIALFSNARPSFIKALARHIRPAHYLHGEYIDRQDDIGTDIFFIYRGIVEVVSNDGTMVFDTMTEGEAFGIISLVFGVPRTASVRAQINTDIFIVSNNDLNMLLDRYPKVRQQIREIAEHRYDTVKERNVQLARQQAAAAAVATGSTTAMRGGPFGLVRKLFSSKINEAESGKETAAESGQVGRKLPQRTVGNTLHLKIILPEVRAFHPQGRFVRHFKSLMCLFAILSCFLTVYQAAFQDQQIPVMIASYVLDALFVIEMIVNLFIGYHDNYGNLVDDPALVRRNYLRRPSHFVFDLVVNFPFELLALVAEPSEELRILLYIRLVHVLRYVNVKRYFNRRKGDLNVNLLLISLIDSLITLFFSIHIVAGLWHEITCPLEVCQNQQMISSIDAVNAEASSSWPNIVYFSPYCTAVYWAVALLTTTGYGDILPVSIMEKWFALIAMIVCRVQAGFILGDITSALANYDSERVTYEQQLDAFKQRMHSQRASASTTHTVVKYYGYLWNRNKGVCMRKLFDDLPVCMRAEIMLAVAKPMWKKIPFLIDLSDSFRRAASLYVNQFLFAPGDYIVRNGDLATGVFFVKHGEVVVVSDEKVPRILKVLGRGKVFGDVGTLLRTRYKWTVRSTSHVQLLSLSITDLDTILADFPDVHARMKEYALLKHGVDLNTIHAQSI